MDIIQDALRNVHSHSTAGGEATPAEQSYFYISRFVMTENKADDEIITWHREENFPRLGALRAVVHSRLFRRADEISDVMTEGKNATRTERHSSFPMKCPLSNPSAIKPEINPPPVLTKAPTC